MKRQTDALTEGSFDLLILGGGITGAGVALDAALRGLRVGLIEQSDFASGTSSASSKLVHGGLRYLEHGDVRLVYEALRERRRLLRNAPHLVRPLKFIIPFTRGGRVPAWKWRVGLTLYDLLAGRGNLHRSRPLGRRQLIKATPHLIPGGLVGGSDYYDAQMDDARLCIEVLRTAAVAGASVNNYVEAVAFDLSGGQIAGVRAVDRLSGREFTIRARQVLNATGPWVDRVSRLAGDERGPHLQPTKGVHLITANRGFDTAFLLLHPADGRVFFVIPWIDDPRLPGRKSKLLIGTTDTMADEQPGELSVAAADITYLLAGYNHYFDPPLHTEDILGTFAGLRPLIRSRPNRPSAKTRDFRLFRSPAGLLSVAGGKYTTYRYMAEVITDRVCRRLRRARRCRTREFPIDGTPSGPWADFAAAATSSLKRRYRLSEESARHLVGRYGKRAEDVAAYLSADSGLAEPVEVGEPDLRVEFVYQREHEMAVRAADFLLRRTRLGLFRPALLEHPPIDLR